MPSINLPKDHTISCHNTYTGYVTAHDIIVESGKETQIFAFGGETVPEKITQAILQGPISGIILASLAPEPEEGEEWKQDTELDDTANLQTYAKIIANLSYTIWNELEGLRHKNTYTRSKEETNDNSLRPRD
jgi:hypothetical protein